MKFTVFLFSFLWSVSLIAQKKHVPFSGELLFKAQRVIPMDSAQEHMLIYAKDSLLKVINFSSNMGKQELIKHLSKEKSYLLLETTKGKYAIRTNYTKYQDTTLSYSFKKKLGSKRIAGMKAKKLSVTFTDIDKKFTFANKDDLKEFLREYQKSVKTGKSARSLAISSDGTALFVVNFVSNTISKVRTSDMKVAQNIKACNEPIGITYDSPTSRTWVACYGGAIKIFDNK